MPSIFHFVLTIGCVASSNGQDFVQRLKYIPRGVAESSVIEPQFSGISEINTRNQFAKVDRICAYGIWALYSTPNYGLGQEDYTTVITVVGKNPTKLECSRPGEISGLHRVKSLRFFGNKSANESGIAILSDSYLRGGKWDPLSETPFISESTTDITGVRMGSIVITGSRPYQICSDPQLRYCLCVDPLKSRYSGSGGGLFLNLDTVRDTASRWLLIVQNLDVTIDGNICESMNNPNYPRAQRKKDGGPLEFQEYDHTKNSNFLSYYK